MFKINFTLQISLRSDKIRICSIVSRVKHTERQNYTRFAVCFKFVQGTQTAPYKFTINSQNMGSNSIVLNSAPCFEMFKQEVVCSWLDPGARKETWPSVTVTPPPGISNDRSPFVSCRSYIYPQSHLPLKKHFWLKGDGERNRRQKLLLIEF